MDASNGPEVTRHLVLGDKVPKELEGLELEGCDLGGARVDQGLAVAAVLRRYLSSVFPL